MASAEGPLAEAMRVKLAAEFGPSHLDIINESAGHGGDGDAESHMKIVIVSDGFAGLAPLKRHRSVHAVIEVEMASIHAMSIVAKTPAQWAKSQAVPESPACGGGSMGA
jgi:stress-induced morphogen